MSVEALVGLFLGSVVSGLLPIVNAELLVAGVAATVPGMALPLVVLASATGQMLTKTALFGTARWAPARLPAKARDPLERMQAKLRERGGAAGTAILTSALFGIPPFYGVSVAAGALGVRLCTFVAAGLAGRALRFAALAWGANRIGEGAWEVLAARCMTFLAGVP